MKIYLASRWGRREELRGYRDELVKMGHVVTSRWLDGHDSMDDGVTLDPSDEYNAKCAWEDYEDIINADAMISFTEDPVLGLGRRGGRHVEFGIALAHGNKQMFIVGPRENVFHYSSGVLWFTSWVFLSTIMAGAAKLASDTTGQHITQVGEIP